MKYTGLKIRVLLVIMFFIVLSTVGCNEFNQKQSEMILGERVENLLKYKDMYIQDDSDVEKILNYLLASHNLQDFKVKSVNNSYEITLKYKVFQHSQVMISTNEIITLSFSDVMIKNSMVLFSLIKDLNVINLDMDNGSNIKYKKSDMIYKYKNKYGKNLEKITDSKTSLEYFFTVDV